MEIKELKITKDDIIKLLSIEKKLEVLKNPNLIKILMTSKDEPGNIIELVVVSGDAERKEIVKIAKDIVLKEKKAAEENMLLNKSAETCYVNVFVDLSTTDALEITCDRKIDINFSKFFDKIEILSNETSQRNNTLYLEKRFESMEGMMEWINSEDRMRFNLEKCKVRVSGNNVREINIGWNEMIDVGDLLIKRL